MKKSIYLHLAAIFLMASAMSGCQDMESLSHSGNIHVVKASIENRTTRVGLSQGDASLDMIAQWQSDDQINILINGGSNTYDVGLVPIQDLSANGKSCTFQYTVPKDLNGASDGYQLNCFTSNCSPKEQGGDIYCDASLVRAPISQFKARVMATQHVDDPDCTAAFRHYGTYEVLHFTNNTDHDITFSLCGFEADNLWYTEGSCALRLSDNSYVADPSYEAVEESPVVTIPAQGTETIVSWYVPNGKKIENAAIVAAINGNRITSSNSIYSDVSFTIGNAYHMYAAWDGNKMRFARGNVTPEGDIPAEAVDLGLPSGTLWASYNVGATKPEEFGGKYAWGETEEKSDYTEENYLYKGKDLGSNISGTQYDVAHVRWGGNWQMPTKKQIEELESKCTAEKVVVNGVSGVNVIGPNGNVIFFPILESGWGEEFWSGTPFDDEDNAYALSVSHHGSTIYSLSRWHGYYVRPVEVSNMIPPILTVFPEDIAFGVVKYGTEKAKELTVTNTSNASLKVTMDGCTESYSNFDVSDNQEEVTLAPGESKVYTVTAHGMKAGYAPTQSLLVKCEGLDEDIEVKMSSYGDDDDPIIDVTELSLNVGETASVKVKNSGYYSSVPDDESVIELSGGGGPGAHGGPIDRHHPMNNYTESEMTVKALKAGVAHITFTDLHTNHASILTVTVTNGSTSYIPAEAVDLGLPSGTLWASWNVGATKSEEVGGYYAWGETETKGNYEWSNYLHCSGGKDALHDIGSNISNTQYDAASVKWGDGWRMPTLTQWKEVITNCTMTKTSLNGVDGVELVSRNNGNSIFMPSTGCRWDTGTYYADDVYCWLADLASAGSATAYYLTVQGNGMGYGRDHERYVGMPIRPVRPTQN